MRILILICIDPRKSTKSISIVTIIIYDISYLTSSCSLLPANAGWTICASLRMESGRLGVAVPSCRRDNANDSATGTNCCVPANHCEYYSGHLSVRPSLSQIRPITPANIGCTFALLAHRHRLNRLHCY